jgi:poly-gamma-glutamate capsule biosynthesis protein CapA/YwtB (metallophosphatase superfamily)
VAPALAAKHLHDSGFTALSLANNHSHDLGQSGFEETKRLLHQAGLRTMDRDTELFEIRGTRLALIAWDDSREPEIQSLLRRVREAKALADWVIIMPHWGAEHRLEPDERQLHLAQSLLTSGADLIVGSGPHVVQRLEHSLHGSVAYSLGNTIFDGPGPDTEWANGALLEVTLETDAERPYLVRARMIQTLCDDAGQASVR